MTRIIKWILIGVFVLLFSFKPVRQFAALMAVTAVAVFIGYKYTYTGAFDVQFFNFSFMEYL